MRIAVRAGALHDLVLLLARNGRWWLIPMVLVLFSTMVLLIAVSALEYVAPFVYTIF
jgi:hypothetical protein